MGVLTGGCGCGAVRFEIDEPLLSAGYCHCTRCQRRSGTAASANARAAPGSVHVVAGAEELRVWAPEGGREKVFCGRCGSALFSREPGSDDPAGVRLGAIDGDPGIRPESRQYVAYAAAWEPLPDDGLPRHPEARPGYAEGR
ncbi:MAG TPA: GFA family protein [Gaiellaceae bacterium]|nr:GFA family protein [Gaiellaceae bacterium]